MLTEAILNVLQRGSIESPSVPLSSAFDLLGGNNKSATGEVINSTKALGIPAYWKGVNLICRGIAKTPLVLSQKIYPEGKREAKEHKVWGLLKKVASGDSLDCPMSAFNLKLAIMGNTLNYGNGFAYIVRNGFNEPIALIWLNPNCVVPLLENGKLVYVVQLQSGETRRINVMNMLHIKGLSFDGITGYSVIDLLKECLGLNIAYEKNQAYFFKNAMRPGWIIQVPWRFKDNEAVQEFRKRLGKVHQGLERSHIPAILENGAEAKPLGMSHDDSQFIQSREFDLRMLANLLFLPSSKLGDNAKSSYNSLEQENQNTLDEAFDPWFVAWESECEFKLLTEQEKLNDSYSIRFNRNSLVQVAFATKIEGYNKAVLGGWLSRDEVRNKEEMNPIPDNLGEGFFIPQNVYVAGESDNGNGNGNGSDNDKEKKEKDSQEKQENSYLEKQKKIKTLTYEQLRYTVNRCVNRIGTQARAKSINGKRFMTWLLDEMYQDNLDVLVSIVDPTVRLTKLICEQSTESKTGEVFDKWLMSVRTELNDIAGLVRQDQLVQLVDMAMVKRLSDVELLVSQLMRKEV